MPNTYFDFKQFRLDQGQSGMKVTTEGCILGAWASFDQPKRILDIGTGTGLLSLMLAQRYPTGIIDAVELDEKAAQQAEQNFSKSPWSSNLTLHHGSIKDYEADYSHSYDLIICNPPFFKNDLKSANTQKAKAIHNDHLAPELLADSIGRLLKSGGIAFILYPIRESADFEKAALERGLIKHSELIIHDNPNKPAMRRILSLSQNRKKNPKSEKLIIKDESGNYATEFIDLLRPYYLHL